MENSLVHALGGYVEAIFRDCQSTYTSNHDWERDKNRSLHELAFRGERFLTIDLPALRKHFEKCLEEGSYSASKLYLSGMVSKRVQVPAFCRDLYLQVFDPQGKLRLHPSVRAIADLRQLFEGFGKLKSQCKQKDIDNEVKSFIVNEAELRQPTLHWDSDDLFGSHDPRGVSFGTDQLPSQDFDLFRGERELLGDVPAGGQLDLIGLAGLRRTDREILGRVCDRVASGFGDLHDERPRWASPLESGNHIRPKHGTGRVSNLRKSDTKYCFTRWPNKLDRIFPHDWYARHDLGHGLATPERQPGGTPYINDEQPSKLIAVPKTMSGPRLIGSEPNYHIWIQQLVRLQLEDRIRKTPLRYCISFGDQRPNRRLSLQGSSTGAIATVDLKSASDRLSCWVIERAFRSNITLLERIHASRTRTMVNSVNGAFDRIKLKKCFTQGSACTFPVQTIVYSMVAIAAVISSSGEAVTTRSIKRAAKQVRVFGDDIIVPTTSLVKLTEFLSFLQLRVNSSKTFSKGKFRESCGLDAYDGVDVTPARVKRFSVSPSHEEAESMRESSNNFFLRGMWHTAYWLQSHLRKYDFQITPIHDSGESLTGNGFGFSSFCGYQSNHLKRRWNKDLHRYEVRVHRLVSNSKRVLTQSAYDLCEFLFTKPDQADDSHLDYLSPAMGGLGVVDKQSSVMRRGWVPDVLPI
jgi:hypothetical protein